MGGRREAKRGRLLPPRIVVRLPQVERLTKSVFQQYLKIFCWLFRIGVMLWFVGMPMLPVYGWLSPWPEAERGLATEGVQGAKFMIGAGGSSERKNNRWSEERQRSYIVLPASLRSMEIFTYAEVKGSDITVVERKVLRSRFAIPLLFLLWISAGWLSVRTVRLWVNRLKKPAQDVSALQA